MTQEGDGWTENRKLILRELERFGSDLKDIRETIAEFRQADIAQIKTEIALLKLKSSLWGAVLGGVSGALVATVSVLVRLVK